MLPVSLAALAALALPGAGGLTILTAAGVRVGYRQAKAGFAVRTAGIARFARPGAVPLGVVRSGSLVVVRPRALRVVRAGGVKRRTIFSIKSPSSRLTRESIVDSMADARVAAIDATASLQDLTEFAGPPTLG